MVYLFIVAGEGVANLRQQGMSDRRGIWSATGQVLAGQLSSAAGPRPEEVSHPSSMLSVITSDALPVTCAVVFKVTPEAGRAGTRD